jgi:hypothetical protein
MAGDVINASRVYYLPKVGQQVPVYNVDTATFASSDIGTGLSLTLDGSEASHTLHDIFVETARTGSPELCVGPAWTNSTVGTASRGTGDGTTQLVQLDGIWVNAAALTTCQYASGVTFSCSLYACTYVGSMLMTANGQTGQVMGPIAHVHGNGNCLCLYNAYNRVSMVSISQDSSASYTDSATTWHAMNPTVPPGGGALKDNTITVVDGLGEMAIDAQLSDLLKGVGGASPSIPLIGIDLDSSTATPSYFTENQSGSSISVIVAMRNPPVNNPPTLTTLGVWYVQAVQSATSSASSPTFGGAGQQQLTVNVDD